MTTRKKMENDDKKAQKGVDELRPGASPAPGLTLEKVVKVHKDAVLFAEWAPDGKMLGTSSKDAVHIHDIASGSSSQLYGNSPNAARPRGISWSSDGGLLAVSHSNGIKLFNSAKLIGLKKMLPGKRGLPQSLAFSPAGSLLAVAYTSSTSSFIVVWDALSGSLVFEVPATRDRSPSLLWSEDGRSLYVINKDRIVYSYDTKTWRPVQIADYRNLENSIGAFASSKKYLAIAHGDSIEIWDLEKKKSLFQLEGHTATITSLCFNDDKRLLVSKSQDQSIKFWRCDNWEAVATIDESAPEKHSGTRICFSPNGLYFVSRAKEDVFVRIWKVNIDALLDQKSQDNNIHYTTAKIILVGDSGVGKSTLGWRLAHNAFKEHLSTHGQQFWVVKELEMTRQDGTNCEVVLWDLAGQPDYRIVHSLFLDNIHLGLLLFDPTVRQEPLSAPLFWLRHLHPTQKNKCPIILVGTRADVGMPTLTALELEQFNTQNSISGGFIATSGTTGEGLNELKQRIRTQIRWDELKATVTTATFKRIKEFVLQMKEESGQKNVLITPDELMKALKTRDKRWVFTMEEMMTAVGNLENHGYVSILQSSKGEVFILLAPEVLLGLASSFVLEARRNPKGLGVLEEDGLLSGKYKFPELNGLKEKEKETLLDVATILFLRHTVCFREQFNDQSFLVFPSLINEKRPLLDAVPVIDDVFYRVSGPVENVFASLAVLLGYTNTFVRNNQWQNQAQYQLGEGEICGFKQVSNREGLIELVLYYAANIPGHVKLLFQGLFERFLYAKALDIFRYKAVDCPSCKERLARTVVSEQLAKGRSFAHCSNCGTRIELPAQERLDKRVVVVGREVGGELLEEQAIAMRRAAFEAAIVRIKRNSGQAASPPKCFVSYAWGESKHEQWVIRLAMDLKKAGIDVVLDRWHNPPGASITEFVDKILKAEFALVIGTPLLKQKYENASADSVVTMEQKLINTRLLQPSKYGDKVIPILLAGSSDISFTPMLQDVVYVDFRTEQYYFYHLFSLIVRLYQIGFENPYLVELQNSLKPERDMKLP
jgi:small GTP-binding protein